MKKLLYRLPRNRSLTKLFSILAVAVAAFAALELLFVQQALAGIVCCTNTSFSDCLCDSSLSCNITKNGKFYGTQVSGKTCWNYSSYGSASQIKSFIECEQVSSGNILLDSTSLQQNALLSCEVTDSSNPSNPHIDTAHLCQLDLSYSRPAGLTQCTNNSGNPPTSTVTYAASCDQVGSGPTKNRLAVNGTLRCGAAQNPLDLPNWCDGNPDCILNLGIADTKGQCSTLFPAGADGIGIGAQAGQVLSYFQTLEGSGCGTESQVLQLGQLQTGYCNGGTFDNAPVDCTPKNLPPLTGIGSAEPAIQFDVTFSPTTLNVTCSPQNNDTWHFTIFGNQHLDVTQVNTLSLAVEGVANEVFNCAANTMNNTLSCDVQGCSSDPNLVDLGPVVEANRNPDGTANLTVTGSLLSGTAIVGEDLNHKTSGHNQ